MNLTALIADNITDVLVKIIRFTRIRQKVLTRNINCATRRDYIPYDLPVKEFCTALDRAVAEHVRRGRLLLRDSGNVAFEPGGDFRVEPVVDRFAAELLKRDVDRYLELQLNKLMENALNQRIAAELLRYKRGLASIFE